MSIVISKKDGSDLSLQELEILINHGCCPEFIAVEDDNGNPRFSIGKVSSIVELTKITEFIEEKGFRSPIRFLDGNIFYSYVAKVEETEFNKIKELSKHMPDIEFELVDLAQEFSTDISEINNANFN